MSSRSEDRKKREKKQEDWLSAQILAIMEKSLKTAIEHVLDDLMKDFR